MKRLSLPNYISRSGARFETTARFLDSTNVVNSTEAELKSAGIPLAYIDENTYATSTDELHCFIIGDSGCGKTRRVILPTIRLLAKTGESMVVSDPKGELYRTTAYSLKEKGYTVQVLNFRNPSRGHRWNPLGLIDSLYRAGDDESKDKAVMMLDDLANVLQQGLEGQDPYWSMSAADVLRGVSLFILEYGEAEELTFENISITAREIRTKILEMEDNKTEYESRKRDPNAILEEYRPTSFETFLSSLPANSAILNNLSVIITNAEVTRNCIMAEFETMVSFYTSQESLMDLFAVSEIDINALGLKPTALFIILPDDTEALYPIATVFVKQIYSTLVALADERSDGKLSNRVTFLLDEFANFAKMPSIQSMLTAARSRGIRFVLVCQSMDQLTHKYEESGRETLLANCRTWVYMSCRNLPFLQRLEELVGYYISPYTNERIPLVDIGELQHFEIGQVLVLNDRCRPMMGYLPDYNKYDFGSDGNDVSIDVPAPHEKIKRNLFSLERALEKAKAINAPDVERREREEKQERDGLRASILEKIAAKRKAIDAEEPTATASPASPSRGDDEKSGQLDVGVDAQIAHITEMEAQEKQKKTDEEKKTEPHTVLDYFRKGDYMEAAKQAICDICLLDSVPAKNNLAFIIRFSALDTTQLSAPFSLEIPDLLHDGVDEKEPFSVLNYALYEIQVGYYREAADLLAQMNGEDWDAVVPFWVEEVGTKPDHGAERALVLLLAAKHSSIIVIQASSVPELFEIAREKYAVFMDSPDFQKVYADSEQKEDPPANAGGGIGSMLELLFSDEDEDEEEQLDEVDDPAEIDELRARLQTSILEKLKKAAETSEEDDED